MLGLPFKITEYLKVDTWFSHKGEEHKTFYKVTKITNREVHYAILDSKDLDQMFASDNYKMHKDDTYFIDNVILIQDPLKSQDATPSS